MVSPPDTKKRSFEGPTGDLCEKIDNPRQGRVLDIMEGIRTHDRSIGGLWAGLTLPGASTEVLGRLAHAE